MSDSYQSTAEQMKFILCTGKTDYVFQIVLQGCEEDEYFYHRETERVEIFSPVPDL